MRIDIEKTDHKAVMRIAGRFDSTKYTEFQLVYEQLLQQPTLNTLVLDMEDIKYFDSSSLGVLLQLLYHAKTCDKGVVLSNPNPHVLQILEQANFRRLFSIV